MMKMINELKETTAQNYNKERESVKNRKEINKKETIGQRIIPKKLSELCFHTKKS